MADLVLGDKVTGNVMLVFPDGTFFHADCVMTVTGSGTNYGATGAAGAAGATGATGATGAASHGQGAAGHHEAKK